MITFCISLVLLILGYLFYGKFVEKVFGPDDRITPALRINDGVDYILLPSWKIFMIQFLNIAGTGPIFGAIMGAKFGPAAYLWIVFGCIFAGATHDYLSGMLSIRNNGAGLPELVGKYLGNGVKNVMLVFTVLLLGLVGAVFVKSPADILTSMFDNGMLWIVLIFAYYIIATMMPVDKIIGKIYPIFAFSLLFMAAALMVVLFVRWYDIPELWETGVVSLGKLTHPDSFKDDLFPALFITIACGAISGFHATQSPLMARCMKNEHLGRPIFYGSMITEGIVALIWATVASYFFYGSPAPGYELMAAAKDGYLTSAPVVVNLVCNDWLGVAGGILAMLGVVAAPITSGDTALRSARLIIADWLHMEQKTTAKRLSISIPIFLATMGLLIWQMENASGFNVLWGYFGWANQALSVFTLWTLTVYLAKNRPAYFWVTLIPALFMTAVCTSFIVISKTALGLAPEIGYCAAAVMCAVLLGIFLKWKVNLKPEDKKEE
ncbi:MAG: carbon starvation protein A [Prevotella sp.]|nr:carbon starvation protein A [Prevotella sp.]